MALCVSFSTFAKYYFIQAFSKTCLQLCETMWLPGPHYSLQWLLQDSTFLRIRNHPLTPKLLISITNFPKFVHTPVLAFAQLNTSPVFSPCCATRTCFLKTGDDKREDCTMTKKRPLSLAFYIIVLTPIPALEIFLQDTLGFVIFIAIAHNWTMTSLWLTTMLWSLCCSYLTGLLNMAIASSIPHCTPLSLSVKLDLMSLLWLLSPGFYCIEV